MLITCLGDVQAIVCNANLPDEDAQLLIDSAVELAAAEVYERLTHARKIELENQALCRQREETQRMNAESERLRQEKERIAGIERQAELKAAEDKNGPRRGHSGSGW